MSWTTLWLLRAALLLALFSFWSWLAADEELAFFVGHPHAVLQQLWRWLSTGNGSLELYWQDHLLTTLNFPGTLYPHLLVTLTETLLAFLLGLTSGLALGLWLGLTPTLARVLSPFIKAANAVPRVVLAPLLVMWLGLGIASKVALGITLVFFAVFFNVYQGVREVSPALLANVRLLGANRWQLIRIVYLPAALGWVFSSLNTVIGLAFVGVVVGEYLGSTRGIGYLILQAEATFDVNTVLAGIIVLTCCALLCDALLARLERRLSAWRQQSDDEPRRW